LTGVGQGRDSIAISLTCDAPVVRNILFDVNEFSPTRSQRKAVLRWNRFVILGSESADTTTSTVDAIGDHKAPTITMLSKSSAPFSLVQSIHASEALICKEQDVGSRHRFEVLLEPCSFTEEKFELYAKYQAEVHNDHNQSESRFARFLVESPLEYSPILYTRERPGHLPLNYGTYHQLYRLDGKLIAMAVLDILPVCVTSAYFMYDPALARFSLGKVRPPVIKDAHIYIFKSISSAPYEKPLWPRKFRIMALQR